MTYEEMLEVLQECDNLNKIANVAASFEHGRFEDRIHITMFYCNPCEYHVFTSGDGLGDYSITYHDTNLVKGRAFIRMLSAMARYNPELMED